MVKLDVKDFAKAGDLFHPFSHLVYVEAVITGSSPGEIYVDQVDHPTAALMATLEPYLLVGRPDNPSFNAGLKQFLREIIAQRAPFNGGDGLFVSVYPDQWISLLDDVYTAAGRPRIVDKRRHYICEQTLFDWQTQIPEGYAIRRVNAELLADADMVIPEAIPKWADDALGNWRERFPNGIGACALYHQEVVCWSLFTCVAGGRCELLIDTLTAHRRRGLATLVTAAMVDFCLADGFTSIGWDCSQYNIPSWRTAERAGFQFVKGDAQHYCMFAEAYHWYETGWIAFREERYRDAIEAYEKSFALNPQASAGAYQEAAQACVQIGETQKAERYRQRALATP